MFRYLLCALGIVFAFPVIVLVTFAFNTPITISGAAYLIGCLLVVAGLMVAPWQRKAHRLMTFSGVGVILAVACMRLVLAREAGMTSNLKIMELPSGKETRWVNYLIDEQDSVLFGEAALLRLGGVSPREHENIASALRTAYSEIRATQSVFPSPFAGTYLDLQKPASFDAIVIEPAQVGPTKVGVVFLHGYMGNVTIQCWQIAQAVQELGATTVCPSTDWIGDWWTPQGESIVHATFDYLHEQGIQTIYLGGFSNGSIGTSRLAPRLAMQAAPSGLFLIAGVTNAMEVRNTGLPVLVIQGTQDERMPVTAAQQFVEEIGDLGTYVEVESDHFLIMKQPTIVQEAIRTWLSNLEAYKQVGDI